MKSDGIKKKYDCENLKSLLGALSLNVKSTY